MQSGAGARAAGAPALEAAEGGPPLVGLSDGPAALAAALLARGPGSAAGGAAAAAGLGAAAAGVLAAAGGGRERGAPAALAELSPAGVLALLEVGLEGFMLSDNEQVSRRSAAGKGLK